MASEAFVIIQRRFTRRLLESGLLVLAVALGVGAATAGLALFLHAEEMGAKTLALVENREIVVSAQSSADDMDAPAVKRPEGTAAILTVKDLDAAELMPMISRAYVSNESEMRFINKSIMERMNQAGTGQGGGFGGFGGPPVEEGTSANQTNQGTQATQETNATQETAVTEQQGRQSMEQRMAEMTALIGQDDVFLPETENLKGFEVSPGFFDAWNMNAAMGSLFSSSDGDGGQGLIVLGSLAAQELAGTQVTPEALLGKKLLSFGEYRTVVGILAPSGVTRYDQSFFVPARMYTDQEGMGMPRRRAMDTQLRFVVDDPANLGQAATLLEAWFTSRYGEDKTVVSNPREAALTLVARNRGISFLILFLAVSGLFMATVNVSNMLLSRGMRMQKSTGILMALGASKQDVLMLFAREALMVALLGGVLGCGIAIPLSRTMEGALGINSASLLGLVPGLLVSLVFVLIFSMIPAVQNSRVKPAESMRSA